MEGVGNNPPDWLNMLWLAWYWRQAPWVIAGEEPEQGTIDLWIYRVNDVMCLQTKFKDRKKARKVLVSF